MRIINDMHNYTDYKILNVLLTILHKRRFINETLLGQVLLRYLLTWIVIK